MSDVGGQPVPEGTRLLRGVRWSVAVLLIAAAAFCASSLVTCAFELATSDGAQGDDGTETVVRPTSDVVVSIRDLARLESAEYHIERVVDLRDRQERLFGLVQAEDAILLVAAGDVTAGVDLTRMRDGDVVVDVEARTARITLPAPEVLSTRLDSERTYVHARETDVMARRSEDLETRARQEAERTLEDAALEAGILGRARTNAEETVRLLVRALGYQRVQIDFADD